jgi:hypothetical protein
MYFEELLAAMLMACVVAGSSVSNSPHIVLPHKLGGQLAHIDLRAACRWICNLGRLHSLRSLVVERQTCNLKVLGSIPSEGYSNHRRCGVHRCFGSASHELRKQFSFTLEGNPDFVWKAQCTSLDNFGGRQCFINCAID